MARTTAAVATAARASHDREDVSRVPLRRASISEQGVDERRDRRALGEDDDPAEQQEGDDHRNHPPELHGPQEAEELPRDRELHQQALHSHLLRYFSMTCWPSTRTSMPLRLKVLNAS